jgi:hypothetical protein
MLLPILWILFSSAPPNAFFSRVRRSKPETPMRTPFERRTTSFEVRGSRDLIAGDAADRCITGTLTTEIQELTDPAFDRTGGEYPSGRATIRKQRTVGMSWKMGRSLVPYFVQRRHDRRGFVHIHRDRWHPVYDQLAIAAGSCRGLCSAPERMPVSAAHMGAW